MPTIQHISLADYRQQRHAPDQFAIYYLGFEDYYAISGQKSARILNLAVSKALRLAYQGEINYEAIFSLSLPS